MTYSKLGNIKGPQGRRGLNMTGGATPPPAVDESTLEGDLWLDSTTGDVYRASAPDPWKKDGTWHTWGTVLWKVADDVLMVQPAEGDTGTTGEPANFGYFQGAPWCKSSNNPSVESMTSVRSKGAIAMNANSEGLFEYCSAFTDLSPISGWNVLNVTNMSALFAGCTYLTDLSPLSGWNVSGVTDMSSLFANCKALTDLSPLSGWGISGETTVNSMFADCTSLTNLSALSNWNVSGVTYLTDMFYGCTSLTDASALSNWDVSSVTSMQEAFSGCPLERIGVPSLDHGGKNFVSNLKSASAVTDMDTTMLTNTTTHETMSANQIIADMDANPSKYSTGTVWTIARA